MKQGRLAGKVAIVTGAAPRGPGIGNGSAVAILFAREGAKVVLVNRSEERARELQRTIETEHGDCMVCRADMTSATEVKQMVEATIQRFGRLDILHNNVGGAVPTGRIVEMHEADWDASIAVNLKSMMLCCKYSVPHILEAGGGSIINASSIAGAVGIRDRNTSLLAYSAAKAGVSGFTRTLAAEYAADGIRVNCIVIGMVDSPLIVARQGEKVLEKRRRVIPLQTTGTGWDVGWAAVYLASDESRWVTGIDLPIDGGQMRILERPR
jgi:NAD(P)-dependent dehydrogenase (short-subunit alcohol dehydrogenase family)